MAETFDPYFKWLGIRPEHQPPDHYRLLGLQRFENDAEVIENAADAKPVDRKQLAEKLLDDAVAMRLNIIEQAAKAPSTAEEKQQALSASLPLLDAGLQANRFAEVERILVPAQAAAKRLKDKRLSDQLAELRKKAGALARDHEKAKAAFAVLQTTPDDPQANLTVGSFWCFAKCTNQRNERGFACVIEFLDDRATIATAPGGAWKLFAPRDQDQWFNPNGIAAVDSAKPADGDKHLRIFEETRLRCLSIWGSNPSRAYFVLKLR